MLPNRLKFKLLSLVAIESMLFAFASAPVARYFMDLLGTQYPTSCNSILGAQGTCYVILAAIANATVGCDYIRNRIDFIALYKKHFGTIILLDSIAYTIISVLSEDCVILRFIGLAALTTLSTAIWNIVNFSQLSSALHGDDLTTWQSKNNMVSQISALIGNLATIAIGDMTTIHTFIAVQVVAVWIIAGIDYSAFVDFERLNKEVRQ